MSNGVAVVTGASSGIGKSIAIALAEAGFDILVHACTNESGAHEVAETIRSMGVDATVRLQDFSETERLPDFVAACFGWKGSVEAWVNNAGADVLTGAAANWSFEQKLAHVLTVDVASTLILSREAGKAMKTRWQADQRIRSMINLGWDQAHRGMAGDSGEMFAASKGAIMACSKSLAQSLAPGVRVNCIAPGWIQTKWGEQASESWQQRAVADSLSGRWGKPDDVAAMASYLCSEQASFVNGQVIEINGGFRFGNGADSQGQQNSLGNEL